MCTAVSYHTKDHYFGRNLDFECSYGESVTITPRRFCLAFPKGRISDKYAMIGWRTLPRERRYIMMWSTKRGLP